MVVKVRVVQVDAALTAWRLSWTGQAWIYILNGKVLLLLFILFLCLSNGTLLYEVIVWSFTVFLEDISQYSDEKVSKKDCPMSPVQFKISQAGTITWQAIKRLLIHCFYFYVLKYF